MTNIEFGKRLRKHRKDRKLTLDQMAELVELSPNYLDDIERGKKFPGTETLIRIVNVLDISADELLKDSVNKADYIIDDELHRMMAQLSPKKRRLLCGSFKPPLNPLRSWMSPWPQSKTGFATF